MEQAAGRTLGAANNYHNRRRREDRHTTTPHKRHTAPHHTTTRHTAPHHATSRPSFAARHATDRPAPPRPTHLHVVQVGQEPGGLGKQKVARQHGHARAVQAVHRLLACGVGHGCRWGEGGVNSYRCYRQEQHEEAGGGCGWATVEGRWRPHAAALGPMPNPPSSNPLLIWVYGGRHSRSVDQRRQKQRGRQAAGGGAPRRVSHSSSTSSCTRLAVCSISLISASRRCRSVMSLQQGGRREE